MEKLPLEIITHLMKYMSFDDRSQMALVNTKCYSATLHPMLDRKNLFNYDRTKHNRLTGTPYQVILYDAQQFNHFKSVLLKTPKKILNIRVNDIEHRQLDAIILVDNISNRIVSLHLENIDSFIDSHLDTITNKCYNLEELILKKLKYVDITMKSRKQLLNLRSLTLDYLEISDSDFNIIIQLVPNLTDLNLGDCKLLNWPQAIRRFYPTYRDVNSLPVFDSPNVFTTCNVVKFLNSAKQLTNLRLELCGYVFFQLSSHVELKSLILKKFMLSMPSPSPNNFPGVNLKLSQHISLEKLEIDATVCCSLEAVSNLHNLKHLKLMVTEKFCDHKTCIFKFFISLVKMKKLKTLHFNKVKDIMTDPSFVVLSNNTISNLTSLRLVNCFAEYNKNVLKFGVNLTSLELLYLNGKEYKLLIKNLPRLRHLTIQNCKDLEDNDLMTSPVSNLKGLISLSLFGSKLSYRCLQYIKCLELKRLYLSPLRLNHDLENFENSLKKFRDVVPSLTLLVLQFSCDSKMLRKKEKEINEIRLNLKSYFKKLSKFELIIMIPGENLSWRYQETTADKF